MIVAAHVSFASFVNVPALAIEDDEGEAIANASLRVASFYEIPMASPRTQAWVYLLFTIGKVYAPRLMAARAMAEMQAAEARATAAQTVHASPPPGAPQRPANSPQTVRQEGLPDVVIDPSELTGMPRKEDLQ